MLRVLINPDTKKCGMPETFSCQLYLALYIIWQTKTKANHP